MAAGMVNMEIAAKEEVVEVMVAREGGGGHGYGSGYDGGGYGGGRDRNEGGGYCMHIPDKSSNTWCA